MSYCLLLYQISIWSRLQPRLSGFARSDPHSLWMWWVTNFSGSCRYYSHYIESYLFFEVWRFWSRDINILILLDVLSIRLIRNLLRRCRCGRISFIREGINFLLITIHLSLISRMVSLFWGSWCWIRPMLSRMPNPHYNGEIHRTKFMNIDWSTWHVTAITLKYLLYAACCL